MTNGSETPTGSHGARCLGIVSGFVLKLARRSTGTTQEAFAEALGVDVSTVQGWESGRRPLTAMRVGDLVRVRTRLTRLGAAASLDRHLSEAIEADLLLATGVDAGSAWLDPDQHPLAVSVHRRSLNHLIAWPLTGLTPAQLVPAFAGPGPAAAHPRLYPAERERLFDHLLTIAERATAPEHSLLRRQAVYLLGFDRRPRVAQWLHADWQRVTRRTITDTDVAGLLESRAASVALATLGDTDVLHDFVSVHDGERQEIANLNYWAYWVGEIPAEQTDDAFMLHTDPRSWGGLRLAEHLTSRITPDAPHLPLNLHSLHALVASRPSLLAEHASLRAQLAGALDQLYSSSGPGSRMRDQLAGLAYAVRLADR